jgi:hypothetical protein
VIFKLTADWIFGHSPYTCAPKTQTRRPRKHGDWTTFANDTITSVQRNDRQHWAIGQTYAVQEARGAEQIGRIRITRIRLEDQAGAISHDDARAEGFRDAEHFGRVWEDLYGRKALNEPCWALTFQAVEGGES